MPKPNTKSHILTLSACRPLATREASRVLGEGGRRWGWSGGRDDAEYSKISHNVARLNVARTCFFMLCVGRRSQPNPKRVFCNCCELWLTCVASVYGVFDVSATCCDPKTVEFSCSSMAIWSASSLGMTSVCCVAGVLVVPSCDCCGTMALSGRRRELGFFFSFLWRGQQNTNGTTTDSERVQMRSRPVLTQFTSVLGCTAAAVAAIAERNIVCFECGKQQQQQRRGGTALESSRGKIDRFFVLLFCLLRWLLANRASNVVCSPVASSHTWPCDRLDSSAFTQFIVSTVHVSTRTPSAVHNLRYFRLLLMRWVAHVWWFEYSGSRARVPGRTATFFLISTNNFYT